MKGRPPKLTPEQRQVAVALVEARERARKAHRAAKQAVADYARLIGVSASTVEGAPETVRMRHRQRDRDYKVRRVVRQMQLEGRI